MKKKEVSRNCCETFSFVSENDLTNKFNYIIGTPNYLTIKRN